MVNTIFILDEYYKTQKVLSVNGANTFFDDLYMLDLSTGVESYEFSTNITDIDESNYVMFYYQNQYKLFQITEIEQEHEDGQIITYCYGESACLELLNGAVRAFSGEFNCIAFFEHVLANTGWSIGNYSSTLADKVMNIKVDQTTQIWSCIQDHMSVFNYELNTRVIYDNGYVKAKLIDIFIEGELGTKTYKRFEYGRNVKGITKKKDLYDWCTALIIESEKEIVDVSFDEGGYVKAKGSDVILAPIENERYNLGRDYIYASYEDDSPSAQEAIENAAAELKRRATPHFDYECDTILTYEEYEDISIGDTVYVIDHSFTPMITLEARVGKLEISFTDRNSCKCNLTNYKEIKSKIDATLTGSIKEMIDTYFPITGDKIAGEAIDPGHIKEEVYELIRTDYIKAELGEFEKVIAETLVAKDIYVEDLEAINGEFKNLKAKDAEIENLVADKATIKDLDAANANIGTLTANVADIQTLINGNLTSDNIQSLNLTAANTTIENALIKDAMIDSVSANKITAGTINTNNVSIQSEDGGISISDETMQFKDGDTVRIQIGKDASGDFTFALYDKTGKGQLINADGIQSSDAIADGLIRNDHVADDAKISGGKLDINSVINVMNEDGSETLKATKIKLDDEGQTLDVAFNTMTTKVDGNTETLNTQSTQISTMQGEISTLITDTTIDGEKLKDKYMSTSTTVDGLVTKVGSLETNYKATLKTSSVQYCLSDSTTIEPTNGWSDTAPQWTANKYMWQRMKYVYTDGSVTYGSATCVAGAKGEDGKDGADGTSVKILGSYSSVEELNNAHPNNNNQGDGYIVNGDLYVWTDTSFNNVGQIKGEDGADGKDGQNGQDGKDGVDGKSSYLHIKYSNDGGTTFTSNNGEDVGLYIGTYVDFNEADPTTVNSYKWALIKGVDGINGADGVDGKDGQNGEDGTSIVFKGSYSSHPANPQNGWAYYNTSDKKSYVYQDNTWYQMTIDGNDGKDGNNGQNGKDGLSIEYKGELSSAPANPIKNWTYRDSDNGIVYIYTGTAWEVMTYDGSNGADGTNGEDGANGLSVYITYNDSISTPNTPTGNGTTNGWHTNSTSSVIWMSQKVAASSTEGTWGTPIKIKGEDGKDGQDGKDGTSVKILGSYNTIEELNNAHPNNNNQGDGYIVDGDLYVWTGSSFENVGKIKGEDGADGKDGQNGQDGKDGQSSYLHIKYSNDGGATFTSNNGEDVGLYIGTCVDFNKEDPTTVGSYKWALIKGTDGVNGADGVNGKDGVNGTSIVFKGSFASHPSTPQNGWAYYNTTDKKSYVYQDNTWYQMTIDGQDGKDGNNGKDGANGKDGLSIEFKGEMSSPPANPTKNWTYKDTDNGIVYIYTGTAWEVLTYDGSDGADGTNGKDGTNGLNVYITYNDSTTTPSTPTGNGTTNGWHTNCTASVIWISQKVAASSTEGTWGTPVKIKGDKGDTGDKGDKGDRGPQGVQGPAGKDGATYYTWIKYADNASGSGLSNDPTGKQYIGFAYNKTTPTESNTASDYTWSKIVGEKGDQGVQGPQGANGTTYYTWIKYSDNSDGTGLYDTPKSSTKYIGIATNKTTASESTNKSDYTWSLFKGDKGDQGIQGPSGEKGQSLISSTPQWYLSTSKTSQTGGSWQETMPTVTDGKYMWLRYKLGWANPTDTTYSTPTLEQVAESVKVVSSKQSKLEQDLNGFKTTVSNTYQTKSDMSNYSTTTQMNSAIDQKASSITSTVSSTYATKNELSGQVNTLNNSISSVSQTANKIGWLIKSGTSQSNMTLTDKTYDLVSKNITLTADRINLHGYVTANGGFSIDTAGNMTAKNGSFSGNISGSTFSSNNDEFRVLEDGTVKSQSLVIDDLITTKTLNVIDSINNPEYPKVMAQATTVYINSSATSATSWYHGATYSSISEMLAYAPRNLNGYTLSITLNSNINENVTLSWFHSGQVNFNFNGYTVNGYVYCYGASMVYRLYGGVSDDSKVGKIMPYTGKKMGSYYYNLAFQYCQFAVNNISMYPDKVNTTNSGGICANRGARGCIFLANVVGDMRYLIRSEYGSHVYVSKTTGQCNNATFCASTGSIISINNDNTQAGRSTSGNPYWTGSGGMVVCNQALGMDKITFSSTGNSGSNNNTSTNNKVTVTETVKSTSADTYRSTVYNSWKGDGTCRQGDYGYGDCQGCWFFGNNLYNIMNAGTVTKVVIRISRQSGGVAALQTMTVKSHNHTSRPSGAPTYTNTIGTCSCAVGSAIDLIITDTATINKLKACKGLGLSIGSTSSPYIVCSGTCQVIITYKTSSTAD